MPVFTEMDCEAEDCVAWPEVLPLVFESEGRAPPSRFRASWIFVSLVSRWITALRARGAVAVDMLEEFVLRLRTVYKVWSRKRLYFKSFEM